MWIKWDGGARPCDFWDIVQIVLRSGEQNEGEANNFIWEHFNTPLDIVFYRVIEKA